MCESTLVYFVGAGLADLEPVVEIFMDFQKNKSLGLMYLEIWGLTFKLLHLGKSHGYTHESLARDS